MTFNNKYHKLMTTTNLYDIEYAWESECEIGGRRYLKQHLFQQFPYCIVCIGYLGSFGGSMDVDQSTPTRRHKEEQRRGKHASSIFQSMDTSSAHRHHHH